MAINATEEEQDRQASIELAEKLKLEKRMEPKLKRYFRKMAADLEDSIRVTGNVQTTDRYVATLTGLLFEQYEDTRNVFSGMLMDAVDEEDEDSALWLLLFGAAGVGLPDDEKPTKRQISASLKSQARVATDTFIAQSVAQDTANIMRTTNKDLGAAVAVAAVTLQQELDRSPTRDEMAVQSKKKFLQHDLSRNATIASTTTQKAAEGTKQIERNIFTEFVNQTQDFTVAQELLDEIWVTKGDSVVRPAHVEANFQKKQNGVFIVKGQQLRFPGDDSLGASLDNIINCRCSAVTRINDILF